MINRSINNGIFENPLITSPFSNEHDFGTGVPPGPPNAFLLLDGEQFLLLDGTHLLLLGA